MDKVSNEVYTRQDLRPCIVKDKKALFHEWSEVRKIVPPSYMVGGHSGGLISQTFGIVELEDGTVKECYPYEIKFLDKTAQKELLVELRETLVTMNKIVISYDEGNYSSGDNVVNDLRELLSEVTPKL